MENTLKLIEAKVNLNGRAEKSVWEYLTNEEREIYADHLAGKNTFSVHQVLQLTRKEKRVSWNFTKINMYEKYDQRYEDQIILLAAARVKSGTYKVFDGKARS